MSFIRPGARTALRRWREALAGASLLALGLWWALVGAGLLAWTGATLAVLALLLIAVGVQRARFRTGGGGPGLVQVDEGRIIYFGPHTGGTVALSEMTALRLVPGACWILEQPGQPPLTVPRDAEGAEALFDAFATLPGLRTERMLAAMKHAPGPPSAPVVIWKRYPAGPALPGQRASGIT